MGMYQGILIIQNSDNIIELKKKVNKSFMILITRWNIRNIKFLIWKTGDRSF